MKMKNTLAAATAAAAAALCLSAEGAEKKFIYCGWDLGRATLDELAESADLFADSAADGVGIYANFKDADGNFHRWSEPFKSAEPFSRNTLDGLVPLARAFAEKSGLRENFLKTSCAPKARMSWTDDSAWRQGVENFAALARFAKMAGMVGIVCDLEDYSQAKQFTLAPGDPDYDTCAALARLRGAELFSAAFREFPEMKVLAYYFYTAELRYVGASDPRAIMRAHGDLFPAFLDGALEVCPNTAQFIDGNELGYRLEAASGDFWHIADHQRRGALPLVAPDLRSKYLATVGVSFGQYIDSYIFPDTGPHGEYHKGPLNGSRLAHFRANLAQAADAADEYVWMWNEYHPYVKWRRNERGADLMAKGTLEETLPGATRTMLSVRSPSRFIDRYCTEADDLVKAGKVKLGFYQSQKSIEGGGATSIADFGGRAGCRVFKGVADGCVVSWLGAVKPGEAFAFTADWKGDGMPMGRCAWRRNGYWFYSAPPARFNWGEPDADGWRRGECLAIVPPDVDEAVFELNAIQRPGETAAYDAIRIIRIPD